MSERNELHRTKMMTKLIKRGASPARILRAARALEKAQENVSTD